MPIQATFSVYIKPQYYNDVHFTLNESGFTVKTSAQDIPENEKGSSLPKFLICIKTAQTAADALNSQNFVLGIRGVEDVLPMYDPIKEKSPWYKSGIIPISISSIVTLILIYSVIESLPLKMTFFDILRAASIPVIGTFLTQILFKYFPHEHSL